MWMWELGKSEIDANPIETTEAEIPISNINHSNNRKKPLSHMKLNYSWKIDKIIVCMHIYGDVMVTLSLWEWERVDFKLM